MMPPNGSAENTSVDEAGSQDNAAAASSGKSPSKESPGSVMSPTDSTSAPVDPFPKKLRDTVHARLKSDGITCVVIAVATTLLHWSGFFSKLQVHTVWKFQKYPGNFYVELNLTIL